MLSITSCNMLLATVHQPAHNQLLAYLKYPFQIMHIWYYLKTLWEVCVIIFAWFINIHKNRMHALLTLLPPKTVTSLLVSPRTSTQIYLLYHIKKQKSLYGTWMYWIFYQLYHIYKVKNIYLCDDSVYLPEAVIYQ